MQPETSFKRRVHYRIDRLTPRGAVFRQAMEAGGGVPDYYYESQGRHLWVEYKVSPNRPSKKQTAWLRRAWANGQPVWLATYYPKTGKVKVKHGKDTMTLASIDDFVLQMLAHLLTDRSVSL